MTVSHLTGVTLRSEKEVNMFMAETLEGYKICRPGDLVINTLWAWMGAMGVAFQRGLVSPAYNVYRSLGNSLNIALSITWYAYRSLPKRSLATQKVFGHPVCGFTLKSFFKSYCLSLLLRSNE